MNDAPFFSVVFPETTGNNNTLCKYHPNSTVTPLNIASWERNLSCDIDSLIGSYCKNKDIIIIRLGENVQDVTTFPDAISRLVKYCQSKAKRVIDIMWLLAGDK